MKEEWELATAMRRIGLQNLRGIKPIWKWNKKHGKLIRGNGKGINWYRYVTFVLKPKLIPFTLAYKEDRPSTLI